MSWFDTSSIANLAKSALKEAQKTIDKALDIQEDYNTDKINSIPADPDPNPFLSSWGYSTTKSEENNEQETVITNSPSKSTKPVKFWGFFDNPNEDKHATKLSTSVESLSDDCISDKFTNSKLVVQEVNEDHTQLINDSESANKNQVLCDIVKNIEQLTVDERFPPIVKRRERPNSAYLNRLSVISSESGRNSSESVEILGTSENTPDSEMISMSSSSSGLKNSDSVEILPDSLASPSSIGILSYSAQATSTDDEYLSPMETDVLFPVETPNKISPDSVEIIPEDDNEESSYAEDSVSFASFSESTTTVLEQKVAEKIMQAPLTEAITRPPSKASMYLSLANTTKDLNSVLISTQPHMSNNNFSLLESPNVINPTDLDKSDSEVSDKTITSAENFMESSGETIKMSDSLSTGSLYVKHMLEDAMAEKCAEVKIVEVHNVREQSPQSSESRSDLVKVGSEQTSEHTSGDELETTTSSDIEIISSPNGDSSSTQSISRQSPAKFGIGGKILITKIKGHNRELSEASSHSDDSHSEIEKLLKRISEMTEILEIREAKLVETCRKNMELVETNMDLKRQLDGRQQESASVLQVTEEYTKRLSSLEKKFQQAIREKDVLKKQHDALKQESTNRLSKNELEGLVSEKEDTIKELREEGEKLSKMQLQQSNIIKKLRTKEKETEVIIKNLKDQSEEVNIEFERLKRSLTAKEEIECSQIEAIHQLTSKNKKLERDVNTFKSQLEDSTQKLETMKTSLDAAKKELIEKKQASSELVAREKTLHELESAKQLTQSQNQEILNQLEDLRDKLKENEQEFLKKERILREENNSLLQRLEVSEARNQELTDSISNATVPLVRQIENLQTVYSFKQSNWEQQEQVLLDKIQDAQTVIARLSENDRVLKEETSALKTKVSSLESKLNSTLQQNYMYNTQIEEQKTNELLIKNEILRDKEILEKQIENANEKISSLQSEINVLNDKLNVEKSNLEVEKRKNLQLQEQLEKNAENLIGAVKSNSPLTRESSPTLSLGHLSLSESLSSNLWTTEDQFDCGASASGRLTNVYNSIRSNSTSILENLQSTLKQRDGEIQQLQLEISHRDTERAFFTNEMCQLTSEVDRLKETMVYHNEIKEQLEDISNKYDALCQMYGEKVEEVQELRLDLQDVKEMYKSQIDDLLNQQKGGQ